MKKISILEYLITKRMLRKKKSCRANRKLDKSPPNEVYDECGALQEDA